MEPQRGTSPNDAVFFSFLWGGGGWGCLKPMRLVLIVAIGNLG